MMRLMQAQVTSISVPKLMYSIAEAELASSLSRATLYRLIAAGKLKTVQAGPKHRRLVPHHELEGLLTPKAVSK